MDILVSTAALALGIFIASAPARAAHLWGSERLRRLTPHGRAWFLRGYRLLGVMLSLAGVLFALDNLTS